MIRSTRATVLTLLLTLLFAASAAATVAGCGSSGTTGSTTTAAEDAQPPDAEAEHGHFSYSGAEGPAHWGSLNPDWAKCSDGKRQSAINLSAPARANYPAITYSYQPEPFEVVNNGHAIEVQADQSRSSVELSGKTYVLDQFHLHAPSEHKLNGHLMPMEIHIVHQTPDKQLAVVAVFVVPGKANPAFDQIVSKLPAKEGETTKLEAMLDPQQLIPSGSAIAYRYTGSLTTPPCTEGVTWTVYQKPITASPAQIDAIKAIYDNNARPVQARNGRSLRQAAATN